MFLSEQLKTLIREVLLVQRDMRIRRGDTKAGGCSMIRDFIVEVDLLKNRGNVMVTIFPLA